MGFVLRLFEFAPIKPYRKPANIIEFSPDAAATAATSPQYYARDRLKIGNDSSAAIKLLRFIKYYQI